MKFLIDAQLPVDLTEILKEFNCDCVHVSSLPNKDKSSDLEIGTFADKQERIVITKDFDFYYSHAGINSPQRLLIVTTGTLRIKYFLISLSETLKAFKLHLKASAWSKCQIQK